MERKSIYVAGPYSAEDPIDRDDNVKYAKEFAQKLGEAGWIVVCPHTMTHNWENETDMGYDDFMRIAIWLLSHCDAIFMVPLWEYSSGACTEKILAENWQMEIYHDLEKACEVAKLWN